MRDQDEKAAKSPSEAAISNEPRRQVESHLTEPSRENLHDDDLSEDDVQVVAGRFLGADLGREETYDDSVKVSGPAYVPVSYELGTDEEADLESEGPNLKGP